MAPLVGAMGRSGVMREHRRQHSHALLAPRSGSEKTGDGRGHVIASSRKSALGEAGSAAKSLTRPAGHAYNSMCGRRRTVNRVDVTPAHPIGPLAQLAEHRTFNPQVVGSNPTGPTKFPAMTYCTANSWVRSGVTATRSGSSAKASFQARCDRHSKRHGVEIVNESWLVHHAPSCS